MPTIMRVMLGLLCAMFVYRTWRGEFPTLDLMFAIWLGLGILLAVAVWWLMPRLRQ